MAFNSDENIVRYLVNEIDGRLSKIGVICRTFGRVKSPQSISHKLESKAEDYRRLSKKMQDLFGVRVALYFSDDVEVAEEVVASLFTFHSKSANPPSQDIFGPTRCNSVYQLPDDLADQSYHIKANPLIDCTFEVQYRTVLSEGWHEVEHDLRYKCPGDWSGHDDLWRSLNGIMATLETCDWSMIKMFDELAWRHYKAKGWDAMIRNKYRLRFLPPPLLDVISLHFSSNNDIAKAIFRQDRKQLLQVLAMEHIPVPLTTSNLVFLVNRLFVRDEALKALEPEALSEILNQREE